MSSDHGVSDEKLLALASWATSELFDESERTVLEYTDAITLSERDVDDELYARVAALLPPDQLVELTFAIAYENLLSKFHRAFRVESGNFCRIVVPTAMPGA